MARAIAFYGLLLGAGAVALQWVQWRLIVRAHPVEAYLAVVAAAFLALGVWAGARLFRRESQQLFTANPQVQAALGISEREMQVLELLAAGRSNKEIANKLELSPNTVKTHVARLFEKLGARHRTEAIPRGRELGMIR